MLAPHTHRQTLSHLADSINFKECLSLFNLLATAADSTHTHSRWSLSERIRALAQMKPLGLVAGLVCVTAANVTATLVAMTFACSPSFMARNVTCKYSCVKRLLLALLFDFVMGS